MFIVLILLILLNILFGCLNLIINDPITFIIGLSNFFTAGGLTVVLLYRSIK